MLEHGFHGVICLPLREREQTFGLLYLYAPEILHISGDETTLLQQLANDLAFGIMSLRARQEQQRLQASVLKMAAAVSASTGTEFFVQLASNMAEALGAQVGCVGRLLPAQPGQAPRAITWPPSLMGDAAQQRIHAGWHAQPAAAQQPHVVARKTWRSCTRGAHPAQDLAAKLCGQQLCNVRRRGGGHDLRAVPPAADQPRLRHLDPADFCQPRLGRDRAPAADMRIRHQASLLDKAQDAIIVRDLEHRIIYWNKSAERLYGWSAAAGAGPTRDPAVRRPHAVSPRHQATLEQGEWTGEIVQRHRDGSAIDVEGRWTLVKDEFGQPQSILAINTDIRQRKATEREIQRLAFYDALTHLPNRMLLMDRMPRPWPAPSAASRAGRCCSSTWTTSRPSTTPWATTRATCCCSRWPSA
jgi:PAS domain S-box-containing protein